MEQVAGLLQNASAYETRGAEAMGRRDWKTAIVNLQQAASLAPDNPVTHLNLGTALYISGDASAAADQFQTAIRLNPGLAKAHFGLGVLQQAKGRDAEAIDHFTAAVNADPSYTEARLQLADALRRQQRLDAALAEYSQIVKADPTVSQARFGYAMALVRLRRFRQAREALSAATAAFPDQPGFPHALARLLAAAPDDSVRDGQRALALLQPLVKTHRGVTLSESLGMALAELGRFEEAVKWQENAIQEARQSGQPQLAERLNDNLQRYMQHVPCRTPWRDDDPVFFPKPSA
jgi:tetratricopeptide (TPR) repeat protein